MRRDELIDKILSKDDEPAADHSLRGRSLRHTEKDYVPKTLTPYEWLEYYEQHGVPESHKNIDNPLPQKTHWYQKIIKLFSRRT